MKSLLLGLAGLIVAAPAVSQTAPVIDNERVTVWDVVLQKGVQGPPTPHDMDAVVMFLQGGTIRTQDGHGSHKAVRRQFGAAKFVAKGSDARDTLISDGTVHEVVIALKDFTAAPIPNKTGLPAAFPRPGSVKVLENQRVVVWHYSWPAGKRTPMHFHDKDTVVAFRYDGTLKSVTPEGVATLGAAKAGEIRFMKGDRTHYEQLASEHQSAVLTELK